MPTKTSPILPKAAEKAAATLAGSIVTGIMEAARSLKEAALPIARELFELRLLFVDSAKVPDVTGSSQAYKKYVKEHVWDVYRQEIELAGYAPVLNLGSFQETVQKTIRENVEAWTLASDLDDSLKDALRIASEKREETRKENEKKREENPQRDSLTELRKAVNSTLSSSRKSKENPKGTLDFSGFIGNAAEMMEQVENAITRKEHGITPKQAAALKEQVLVLSAHVKKVGTVLSGIISAAEKEQKQAQSNRNARTGSKQAA